VEIEHKKKFFQLGNFRHLNDKGEGGNKKFKRALKWRKMEMKSYKVF
jgi:hypothetical protein